MRESNRYVSVAAPTPLRTTFQYRLKSNQDAPIGARVVIPFGRRRLIGVIIGTESSPKLADHKIRDIVEVLPVDLSLTAPILKLCEWAAGYYHHPIGEVISNALPGLIRKGGHPRSSIDSLALTPSGSEVELAALQRAPAQRHLLQRLQSGPLQRDALKQAEITSSTVRTLVSKGWAVWQSDIPDIPPPFRLAAVNDQDISPNQEQLQALRTIKDKGTHLLQGVTGSGKTEVYFRLIEPLLKAGRQALVLVPEIGLTPQTIARFKSRFDVEIAVLHSSLNDRERANGWLQAKEGSVGIVLGTRSAIFTPLADPGIIIVDEEHDSSYKQQDGFRYSARDLAVLRGQFESCSVILGSATPSLESLHNADAKKYQHLALTRRPEGTQQEQYQLIDTRHLEKTDGFTRPLVQSMTNELNSGNQVLVFLNRRGFAPVMMCSSCRWIAQCQRCDAKLTYHLKQNTLVCHHCGTMHRNITRCQACGDRHVAPIGLGTQRIEQTLKTLFPAFPVLRIDRDSTRRQGAMASFVEEINRGEPAILVGTQLLAKGHHFPDVTLVAMLDIDASFYSSDYRALERLGQLVLQVGGRAGRAGKSGRVIIQSEFASQPLLKKLISEGYTSFARELLKERQDLQLPPYQFHVIVRAEAHSSQMAHDFLEAVMTAREPDPTVNLLGPIPALMEKKAGRYRHLAILTARDRASLHRELDKRINLAEQSELARKVRWSIDVDPVDLF